MTLPVGELVDFTSDLDNSPLYQDTDELIDAFDPSEPPKKDKEGIADPMNDLIKAEIAAVREPVKWALCRLSYISPEMLVL